MRHRNRVVYDSERVGVDVELTFQKFLADVLGEAGAEEEEVVGMGDLEGGTGGD